MNIRNRLKALERNKDAKTLFENFVSLSFLQIANYLFPLVTLPYLAKTIGVDKFGILAFGASVIIYFKTFVDFGFQYTAVRDISQNRNDPKIVSKIFSSVMTIRFIFMLLSFAIMMIMISTMSFFYDNRIILLLTFLYIPGYVFFPDWFFQAIEQMKYITFLNFLSKLLFTVLVFIVIKEKSDYVYQPVLTAIGYFVSGAISMVIIIRRYNVKYLFPSFQDMFRTIKEGSNMFLSLFMPNLYTNFSVVLLNLYGGEIPTGIFSSGLKFIRITNQVSGVLSRTFFPFLARRLDKHSLYRNLSGVISLALSLILFFSADLLIKLFYTDEFADSAEVIRIMSLAPLFLFLMNTYGINYLVLIKKENVLRNIIIVCSMIGFSLSWILVKEFSFIGAAFAITLTWLIRGMTTWFFANRLMLPKQGAIKTDYDSNSLQ